MIKITMDELWKVQIGRMIRTKYGAGMYLGKEEWGYVLWDGWQDLVIEEYDSEDEVVILDYKIDINTLVDVQIGKLCALASNGWTLDKDSRFLNINGEIEKLRVYVEVQKIVGSTKA